MEPILLVQGGAGTVPTPHVEGKLRGVKLAAARGYKVLTGGGSVVDAVEAAVRSMEDDENFNAGVGSMLNLDGEVEMDASVMVGADLSAGAVTVVKDIAHPISLARMVMERTPHVLLAGHGANKFAEEQGIPRLAPGLLVTTKARQTLQEFKAKGNNTTEAVAEKEIKGELDTVGAVAIDAQGNLAAATSTGGINGKMVGRSSDTCMIGAGTYADNLSGAVSTTGHGETIAKYCLAHAIVNDIVQGKDAQTATDDCLKNMTSRLNNTAGAITISKTGDVGVGFTSKRMSWAYQKGNQMHFGIEHNQHEIETISN